MPPAFDDLGIDSSRPPQEATWSSAAVVIVASMSAREQMSLWAIGPSFLGPTICSIGSIPHQACPAGPITTTTGNDVIVAGSGNDTVNAGDGDNSILGDDGAALLVAGVISSLQPLESQFDGADSIVTGTGNDTILCWWRRGQPTKQGGRRQSRWRHRQRYSGWWRRTGFHCGWAWRQTR